MAGTRKTRFVVFISNEGCEDLELRKLYEVVSTNEPEEVGCLRVVAAPNRPPKPAA